MLNENESFFDNAHVGLLLLVLVKLQAEACNFTKINTPPWAFST